MNVVLQFGIGVAALVLLVWTLLRVDAGMRGWRRIASRFPAPDARHEARRQDGAVGTAGILQLRGLIRARMSDDGLFIAAPRVLRHTHPPLLIPWEQVSVRDQRRRLGVPILTLSIGRMHLGFITLRGGVAGEVLEQIAKKHGPDVE